MLSETPGLSWVNSWLLVPVGPVPPALIVERVERRGRLSVAFRLLLVLPQVVVLYVLVLVGGVAVVVGWFAALALVAGRVPGSLFDATTVVLRYNMRTTA